MNGKALTYEEVLSEVLVLEKAVIRLKTKLLSFVPPKYGSDEWWKESDRKAFGEMEKGEYTEIRNKAELQAFLNELKS